jgi:hypothetical protein
MVFIAAVSPGLVAVRFQVEIERPVKVPAGTTLQVVVALRQSTREFPELKHLFPATGPSMESQFQIR